MTTTVPPGGDPRPLGRAGLTTSDLSSREVAEALWLCSQMASEAEPASPVTDTPSTTVRNTSPTPQDAAPEPDPDAAPPRAGSDIPEPPRTSEDGQLPASQGQPAQAGDQPAGVAQRSGSRTGSQDGVPRRGHPDRPPSLDVRAIERALRPLKRFAPSPHGRILDEEATAERAAEDSLWLPVYVPAEERLWDIVLVVDGSLSMTAVWQETAAEIALLLQRQGAFRDVQVRRLETETDTPEQLVLRPLGGNLPAQPPSTLLDPTGRRIVLVLTDGAALAWHTGAVLPALWTWGRVLPVAVVHLLPQPLWHRTGINPLRLRLRAPTAGTRNAGVRWEYRGPGPVLPDDPAARGMMPIPVLELDAAWLATWARLMSGTGTGWTYVTALLAGTRQELTEDHGARPDADERYRDQRSLTPLERVASFRAAASPEAFALATYLAAAPLNPPVMRLVQDEVLPTSVPSHLSEIFLSGLLRPLTGRQDIHDADRVTFDFQPGVREELLACGRQFETRRVARAASRYWESRTDAGGWVAGALAAPGTVAVPSHADRFDPFIDSGLIVLQALSGRLLESSRRIVREFRDNSAPTTDPAVVSGASDQSGRPPAEAGIKAPSRAADHPAGGEVAQPTSVVEGSDPSDHHTSTARAERIGHPGGVVSSTAATPQTKQREPVVWGIVPLRNPNFTGREELLEQLHERLRTGTTAVLPQALHGMGGVGKSQLAIEYIYRHSNEYDVVWWIPSARSAQIGQALVELAQRLDLHAGTEANTAVPAVREALRSGQPYANWLLVFDNAEDPQAVRPYFPAGGRGSILVTSRNPEWTSVANSLEVDVFTRPESIELLQRRGPGLATKEADRLAEALGDLPLALEQAAAWRVETGMPADEYLRLLEEKRNELLELSPPIDYQLPVAAAWNLSLDQLAVKNPAALQLLQVCSFFAPDPISRSLFAGARKPIAPALDGAMMDPIRLNRAIRDITRYSLARIDPRTSSIQMHRLVQLVLIGRMSEEERATMRHGAHLLLAGYDPNAPQDPAYWARYAELYPHVVASEAIDCPEGWVRQLVYNEARFLFQWGDHEESRDLAQHAYEALRLSLGEDAPETLRFARWLGFVLRVVGRYQEAAELNASTLESYRRTLGVDHEDTLVSTQQVVADLHAQGEFARAVELSEDVWRRCMSLFGVDDPGTLNAAHTLGVSLRLAGDFARARELDQDTWERLVELHGIGQQATLNTAAAVAIDRRELGEYVAACAAQEDVVSQFQRLVNDPNNHTYLRSLDTLAVARRKAGDHGRAREVAEKAQTGLFRRYGMDHPATLVASLSLAVVLQQTGDLVEARRLGEETFHGYQRVLGDDHPHTLAARVSLAVTDRLLGEVNSARDADEMALSVLRRRLGDSHPSTLACAANLASDLYAEGEFEKARGQDKDVLERFRRVFGQDHPSSLMCAANLAMDLRALDRVEEAESLHDAAVARLRRDLGPEHPATVAAVDIKVRANFDIDPMPL